MIIYLQLNELREIIDISCSCCYNQSKACKHIAALIYFVNNEESLSKTDEEQKWGSPTAQQFAKKKYSKGKYFCEMFPPKEELLNVEPYGVDLAELEAPSALKTMLSAMAERRNSNNKENHLDNGANSVLTQAEQIQKKNFEKRLQLLMSLWNDDATQFTPQLVQKENQAFYEKCIVLNVQQILDLCYATMKQSDSSEWYRARRLRISASKNAHSIKSRKTKPIGKLIEEMLFSKHVSNNAIDYGKEMESVARQQYEREHGVSVERVGVIVCHKKPWLCASLDGIVYIESHPNKIVEIKCPFSCKNLPIVDNVLKKCNVSYLQFENNNITLKSSAIIYTQCQIQMYVSGMALCDVYVYSPIESCTVRVYRHNAFFKKVLFQCEEFYFQHYLPALNETIEKESARSMKIKARTFTGQDISNTIKK